jgi:hypothetical protein
VPYQESLPILQEPEDDDCHFQRAQAKSKDKSNKKKAFKDEGIGVKSAITDNDTPSPAAVEKGAKSETSIETQSYQMEEEARKTRKEKGLFSFISSIFFFSSFFLQSLNSEYSTFSISCTCLISIFLNFH